MKGRVFEIREFCLHDGPGVRTTVFLKGCTLRCSWCHNPEGLDAEPEVFRGRVVGELHEASELAEELKRNEDFFDAYGGGVTFSGGEPFAQIEFFCETCSLLKPLHVAVETSGHVSANAYRRGIEAADYILQDLKHWDCDAFRRHCRGDLGLVLENIALLKQSGKPHVIRIPLIPGVNDGDEDATRFAELLDGDRSIERVEFLPYHQTAAAKYALMGREYSPTFNPDVPPRRPSLAPFALLGIPATLQ